MFEVASMRIDLDYPPCVAVSFEQVEESQEFCLISPQLVRTCNERGRSSFLRYQYLRLRKQSMFVWLPVVDLSKLQLSCRDC